MLYLKTRISIFDNTGISLVRCITIPGIRKNGATLGSFVVVVPKKKQFKNTDLSIELALKSKTFLGLVVCVRKKKKRKAGYHIMFDNNGLFLMTKDFSVIGHRLLGPVCREVLQYPFMRELTEIKRFF